jgi:hypothetical protein
MGNGSDQLGGLLQEPPCGSHQINVIGFMPGSYPLRSLVSHLVRLMPEGYWGQEKLLAAGLKQPNEQGDYDELQQLISTTPELAVAPLVIIVDQFEEVFTLCNRFCRKKYE